MCEGHGCCRTGGCSARVGWACVAARAHLCAAKVNELEPQRRRVDEQVVGLQVSVADALRVNVLESLERLIEVDAHVINWKALPLLLEAERNGADGVGQKVHHEVQIRLVALAPTVQREKPCEGAGSGKGFAAQFQGAL